MIDSKKFQKIYEKIQIEENHNLVVGQISKLTGVDANTVQQVAAELGITDLTNLTQDQYNQICATVKDTQKLTIPKKEPIKDEENLDSLNEAEPDDQDPNADQDTENQDTIDETLLYDIIYAYYMATAKDNPKAKEFLTTLNSNPLIQRIEKKYSALTTKSNVMQKQDSTKASPNNLKSMLTMLFSAITKAKKEELASNKKNL